MKIESVPLKYTSPLVNSYLCNFQEVGHLFEHNPANPEAFRDRYEIIMRDYCTDRAELVRILTEYNESLHCSEKTRENMQALKEHDTVAIITGQQAGILTGPLYTIYKAITAIQLAAEVSRHTGIRAVPMFWVASEDHDYAEIDHLDFINREMQVDRLKIGRSPGKKYSIGDIPVTEDVYELIEKLEELTNSAESKHELINRVRGLAGEYSNLADWFAAIMSWFFHKHGLIMVNPLNRKLRGLLVDAFTAFLEKSANVNEKLQSGTAKVRQLGSVPQVEKVETNANMFIYIDGERLPLFKDGELFTVRGRDEKMTLSELAGIARNSPYLLSPNVVLRPVAQDILLPIMAYVAGPGEISYYALYREIYPLFNQRMPLIYPRVNITLVEKGTAKNMDRYGISFADGVDGLRQKLNHYLNKQDKIGIDMLFENYAGELKELHRRLMDKVAAIDPELVKHGSESLNRILHQVDYLEKKTHQQHRKTCDVVIKRFQTMENQLFPRNNWQERVFNIFPYMFKYGTDFVEQLTELPLLRDFDHKLIYL